MRRRHAKPVGRSDASDAYYYSINELAARWGVCRRTIERALEDESLHHEKVRDRTLISKRQEMSYLRKTRKKTSIKSAN